MASEKADIQIEIDPLTLKALETKLGNLKSKAPRVIKNAVNATARDAKKDLAAQAQKTYVIKTTKFNRQITQKNATVRNLMATLTVAGRPNKLEDFQTRKNTKTLGAKARGRKDKTLKEMVSTYGGRAFTATFASGHTAIVQREGKERLPIKGFYGPSDPAMVGSEKVYGKLKSAIQKELNTNIKKQMQKLLSQ